MRLTVSTSERLGLCLRVRSRIRVRGLCLRVRSRVRVRVILAGEESETLIQTLTLTLTLTLIVDSWATFYQI